MALPDLGILGKDAPTIPPSPPKVDAIAVVKRRLAEWNKAIEEQERVVHALMDGTPAERKERLADEIAVLNRSTAVAAELVQILDECGA